MKQIVEYLLSGKNKNTLVKPDPKMNCTVDDFKKWLVSLGADTDDFISYDGMANLPKQGKILIEIGPCLQHNVKTFWIAIRNSYNQSVNVRIKCAGSFYIDINKGKEISFETALEMVKWMIDHESEKINFDDFTNDEA